MCIAEIAIIDYNTEDLEPPILTVEQAVERSSFFEVPSMLYPSQVGDFANGMAEADHQTVEQAVERSSFFEVPSMLYPSQVGDFAKGMTEADHQIHSAEIRLPSQKYFYIETQTALAILDEDNCMVVYSSIEVPEYAQTVIARCLNIPEHNVWVITRRVGGSFSGKAIKAMQCSRKHYHQRYEKNERYNRQCVCVVCEHVADGVNLCGGTAHNDMGSDNGSPHRSVAVPICSIYQGDNGNNGFPARAVTYASGSNSGPTNHFTSTCRLIGGELKASRDRLEEAVSVLAHQENEIKASIKQIEEAESELGERVKELNASRDRLEEAKFQISFDFVQVWGMTLWVPFACPKCQLDFYFQQLHPMPRKRCQQLAIQCESSGINLPNEQTCASTQCSGTTLICATPLHTLIVTFQDVRLPATKMAPFSLLSPKSQLAQFVNERVEIDDMILKNGILMKILFKLWGTDVMIKILAILLHLNILYFVPLMSKSVVLESVAPPPLPPPSSFICPISVEPLVNETTTKCGHVFGQLCIGGEITDQPRCPICRHKLKHKDLIKPKLLDFGLAKLGPTGDKSHVSTRVAHTQENLCPISLDILVNMIINETCMRASKLTACRSTVRSNINTTDVVHLLTWILITPRSHSNLVRRFRKSKVGCRFLHGWCVYVDDRLAYLDAIIRELELLSNRASVARFLVELRSGDDVVFADAIMYIKAIRDFEAEKLANLHLFLQASAVHVARRRQFVARFSNM
ncbi:abscisic aldehyde oxidase 3 [Artemisia annua]|uniref:Abscisic aldehyde oxidase 3 n=1 Tax=Artemisia annua TaxID=35608 RepID=A0A2U1PK39_ARTAN|nr:abscisic aldehyde oxidase 3 [Artemisia annua]